MMPGNADEISHSPKPGDPEIRTNSCQSHLMQTCCTTTIGTVMPDSTSLAQEKLIHFSCNRYYEFRGDGVKQSKQGLLNEACSYNALGNNPKIITGETSLMPTDKSIGADQKDFYKNLWSA